MSDSIIPVTHDFLVTHQIKPSDIARAAQAGVTLIVNNRPDGEVPGQPLSADLKTAAQKAGIAYMNIAIDQRGLTPQHIGALHDALTNNQGKTLAFCRTGTRSIFLWAYAAAKGGTPVGEIISTAAKAGYDVASHEPALHALRDESNKP